MDDQIQRRRPRGSGAHKAHVIYMTAAEKLILKENAKESGLNLSASVVQDAIEAPELRRKLGKLAQLPKAAEAMLHAYHSPHGCSLPECSDPMCSYVRSLLNL